MRAPRLLSLTAAALLLTLGAGSATAQAPIKLGDINTYSGIGAPFTGPYRQGVEMAAMRPYDVILMDLRMPQLGGVEAIVAIRKEFPDARLIVLTTFDGDEDIYRSLQAGAQGYLLKDMFFEELEEAIRKVHGGSRRIPTQVAERLAERMGSSDLTGREIEVLEHIVGGNSNKAIASRLNISEATVKSHINNILSKLGVSDRTQAATTALQRGLVHLR